MAKKLFFTLLMILSPVLCQAQITKIYDMQEVLDSIHYPDSKMLVIFDVDMVLIQPSEPAFQMANMKHFSPICKRILSEIPLDKRMIFLSLMTTSSNPVLVDKHSPHILQQLMQKDIPTMAFTGNLTGSLGSIDNMEQWRLHSLRKLGIDFSPFLFYPNAMTLSDIPSYRGNHSTYIDGILFANGDTTAKGEVFLSFLKKIHFTPTTIFFIDDREENLQNLQAAIQTLNPAIEYRGFHFLGAQNYPSPYISQEEFEARWQKLAAQAKELS